MDDQEKRNQEPGLPAEQAPEDLPAEQTQQEHNVEAFVPTDYFQQEQPKKRLSRGGIIAICAGALALVLACAGLIYLNALRNDPGSFFHVSRATATPLPATPDPSAAPTQEPTPSPTLDPYTALEQQADLSMMQNIVNVAFIGVDYAEERLTGYAGKAEDNAFHADVILILAINFDENRVDLISIPRDTYANIPGVKGIYKINASLDCGGGLFAENGAGFEKVCEAAEWMLGGIPVDYYYAVTMPAVKQLVDAVGGVDYDLELNFKIQGRSYKKGQQHMDGQAVLDYLRVRKNVTQSGDNNRVNRQKKMMVALFKSMQQQNLLLKLPDMIAAFEGQLYTNTNFSQTAALALFAYNLSADNIGMYSMGSGSNGTSGVTNIFNWNFCLTDQGNRVRIIKEIYGVDVPQYREYTRTYAFYRWYSMLAEQYLDTCEPLTELVEELLAADDLLPTISPAPSITPEASITPATPAPITPDPGGAPTLEPTVQPGTEPTVQPTTEPTASPAPTPDGKPVGPAEPTEKPSEAPTASPAETPAQPAASADGAQGTSAAGGLPGALRRMHRAAPEDEGVWIVQQYSAEQRALAAEYFEAIDTLERALSDASAQAKRYRNGNSNSLSARNDDLKAAMDEVKSLALRVAAEYGYKASKLYWKVKYEYDSSFNEVRVNFN